MKSSNKVVIFHFSALELYPPIINLGTYISFHKDYDTDITILTTNANKSLENVHFSNIDVIRYKGIDPQSNSLKKIGRYIKIYLLTFWFLCKKRPKVVLYFETLSSLPVVIYKILFKRVCVFIHYHELVTFEMLNEGRALNNILNRIEMRFYSKADWISQTNKHRMEIFEKQYHLKHNESKFKILPNFPPLHWLNDDKTSKNDDDNKKIKILYIGSLSFEGMYLKEVLSYFGNNENFQLDFYSHTLDSHVLDEFKKYMNVFFKGSIDYNNIPALKNLYKVGLVLYKGNSLNVKYCAPNKIFEYLALDLDVWCSDKLITAHDYINEQSFPKLLMVDFNDLKNFDIKKALNREGIPYKRSSYFCEDVYKGLWNRIDESINS